MRNPPVTLIGTPCKYLVEHSFGVTEVPSFFVAQIQQAADLPVAKCLIVLTVISAEETSLRLHYPPASRWVRCS